MDAVEMALRFALWEQTFRLFHTRKRDALIRDAQKLEAKGYDGGALRRHALLHETWIKQRDAIVADTFMGGRS